MEKSQLTCERVKRCTVFPALCYYGRTNKEKIEDFRWWNFLNKSKRKKQIWRSDEGKQSDLQRGKNKDLASTLPCQGVEHWKKKRDWGEIRMWLSFSWTGIPRTGIADCLFVISTYNVVTNLKKVYINNNNNNFKKYSMLCAYAKKQNNLSR